MSRDLIPEQIIQTDLAKALEPLCDLLNITSNHLFASPLVIDGHQVILAVPSPATAEEWDESRPGSQRAIPVQAGRRGDTAEQMQVIRVEVLS